MPVYFVHRSHYDGPGCKAVARFDADTVLGWFRSFWKPPGHAGSVQDYADQRIGVHASRLGSLFERIQEDGWPPPKTMTELERRLEDSIYLNEIDSGPHYVQIMTDDDELESAVYLLDGHYAAKRPDVAAYLTREDWRLPDGRADGPFRPLRGSWQYPRLLAGEGHTYFVAFAAYDSCNLTDLEGVVPGHVPGVRLPDLARYLVAAADYPEEQRRGHFGNMAELFSGLAAYRDGLRGEEKALFAGVRANPGDVAAWSAYSDWLEEHGRPPAGEHLLRQVLTAFRPDSGSIRDTRDPTKDQVLVQSHVAQAGKHVALWEYHGDVYHHFLAFDDRWAAAHPDLAKSVLRVASHWQVL